MAGQSMPAGASASIGATADAGVSTSAAAIPTGSRARYCRDRLRTPGRQAPQRRPAYHRTGPGRMTMPRPSALKPQRAAVAHSTNGPQPLRPGHDVAQGQIRRGPEDRLASPAVGAPDHTAPGCANDAVEPVAVGGQSAHLRIARPAGRLKRIGAIEPEQRKTRPSARRSTPDPYSAPLCGTSSTMRLTLRSGVGRS